MHDAFFEKILKNLTSTDPRLVNGAVDLLFTHSNEIPSLKCPSAQSIKKYLSHLISALLKGFDSVKTPFSLFLYDDISLLLERLVDLHNRFLQINRAPRTPPKLVPQTQTFEVFNFSFDHALYDKPLGRRDGMLEAFMNVQNFTSLRALEFTKSLYSQKKLPHLAYLTLWTKQLIVLVRKNINKSELFNLYFEVLFQEDLFFNQIFILRLLGFIQKRGSVDLLRGLYLKYLTILSDYLNKLVDVASNILKKFDKTHRKEVKKEPVPGESVKSEVFVPTLEEVPENIITGINFDDYNVKIKAAVNLLLETFKFYYRLIKFVDRDEVVKEFFEKHKKHELHTGNGRTHQAKARSSPSGKLATPTS